MRSRTNGSSAPPPPGAVTTDVTDRGSAGSRAGGARVGAARCSRVRSGATPVTTCSATRSASSSSASPGLLTESFACTSAGRPARNGLDGALGCVDVGSSASWQQRELRPSARLPVLVGRLGSRRAARRSRAPGRAGAGRAASPRRRRRLVRPSPPRARAGPPRRPAAQGSRPWRSAPRRLPRRAPGRRSARGASAARARVRPPREVRARTTGSGSTLGCERRVKSLAQRRRPRFVGLVRRCDASSIGTGVGSTFDRAADSGSEARRCVGGTMVVIVRPARRCRRTVDWRPW